MNSGKNGVKDPNVVGIIKPRRMAWMVLCLTVICASVALILSLVNVLTRDKIAENLKMAEETAIGKVWQEVAGDGELAYSSLDGAPESVSAVYKVTVSGELVGFCVSVSPSGFGGNIDMIVGVDPEGRVVGVEITALSETPGLGSKVGEASFLERYRGKSGTIVLGVDVDAISGATISSRSVTDGVNRALFALGEMELIERGETSDG
jgi:electron transport complex protein RnfG